MIAASVIIVNWNTKEMLLSCIDSIYQHSSDIEFEIIVVDNDSTDGSQHAVKKQFPGVKLICNDKNVGFARANNIGIRASSGRYVCLVNSDIEVLDNVIFKLVSFLESNARVGIVGPKTVNPDFSTRYNCRELPTVRNAFFQAIFFDTLFPSVKIFRGRTMYSFDYNQILPVEVLSGCFLVVRNEVIKKVGLLDENFFIYGEDVDWCKRISDAGWEIFFYGDTQVIHYAGSSSSKKKIRFSLERLKSDLYFWKKHHSILERALFISIIYLKFIIRLIGWTLVYVVKPSKSNVSNIMRSYLLQTIWLTWFRKYSPAEFLDFQKIKN
ncbi:MAG: glycosyltransferase family 2 protein [Candidatus Zhuqueibacterota bacterium]